MDQGTTNTASAPNGHPAAEDASGFEWCIVEIFGHRRHAGRGREEEKFGSKMLRIDVPVKGDAAANGYETHWYPGSAIFSFTLTDEDTVMRMNKPYEAASRYRLPAPEPEIDEDDHPFEPTGPDEAWLDPEFHPDSPIT